MYCLEKLQREIAYFFDMDLRELPRVQDLLAAKGYTQVQKGDEIIKLEPSAQSRITPKRKNHKQITKDELDNLPIATAQEYGEFLEKIAQKDYQNTPEILKIATLNNDLQELINNNHSASVFITRARAGHISEARKGEYNQALTLEEQKQIPAEIAQAKQAYTDDKSGFILPFADKNNNEKINLIILDSDSKGNFLITAKKVNSAELNNPKYKKLARAGVEPATTTPPKAEQKPTEAISLARDDIIPQTPQEIIKQAKASGKSVGETKELPQKAKELESKKDLNNELDFNGRTSQWQQEVIKQLELDKQASNKIVKIDNDSFIVYDGMSMYYYDKKSYDKALSNKDEYIKGVTEQQKSIAARSYKPYKDFSPPHFIDAIQPEKLIQYYHNMPEKQLQRLAESLRSGMNDNEFFTFIQNRSKEDVIYAQGHGFLSYLRKYFDLDFSDYPFTNLFLRKFFGKDKEAQQENFTKYVDKLYKDNGYPFGYVFNDSKTMQTLKDEDTLSRVQGINAIRLLLNAKYGHIENAFHRKELGDIDLVWGEVTDLEKHDGYGLAHILDKRKAEFMQQGLSEAEAEAEALEFAKNEISNIMQNGKITNKPNEATKIETQDYKLILKQNWNGKPLENKWLVTAYIKKEKGESISSTPFTKGDNLPLNSSEIIPQPTQKSLFDTQEATPPKVDSSDTPPSKINFTYTTGEAKGIAELRKDLKAALEPYKSTPITNKETGLQGVVTTDEINKIASKKAVDKSVANGFSRDEHFKAAQDLKNLFENSKLKESHADNKHRENIKVHRFIKDIHINDKQAQAKITLFEKIEGKNRIYTLELESLNKPDSLSASVPNTESAAKAQSVATARPETTTIAKTDEQSIAQNSNALLESTMKKFNYDERKAKDLLEWHKDSHPLTKDENGVPKVFYTAQADELFEVFSPRKDNTKWGFWFASGEDYADHYGKSKYGARQEPLKFSTFLKVKNPFDMTDDKNLEVLKKIMGKKEYEAAVKEVDFNHDNGASKIYRILSCSPFDRYKDKARAFQNKLKKLGYDGIKEQDGVMIVFESNQIKHIENRGVAGQYFYSSSPNIFHTNPHAGAGLLGGSVAGIEQDENGNITFNPEKFALGLLGGAVGSKAVAKGLEWRVNKVAKSYPNIAKDNPTLMQEIAKRDLQTYAMRNTHNALTRFLNKNKALDINPQLFAGEKALVNEAYAPHKARLAKAKELESKGADEIEIWEQTGWYKDKDKKWKFEISQRGGEFDFSGLEFYTFSRDNRVKLSRILKDNELFTAYPSLKNLIVNFDYGIMNDHNLGWYAIGTKEITLNAKRLRDDKSRLSTLYHEIQHAIQDIEGFGFGYKEAENFREISQEGVERYAKQHGEVEARNVQKRLDNGYIGEIYSKQSLKDEIQELKDVRLSLQKSDPDLAEVLDRRIKEYEKNYKNLGEHDIYNTRRHPHKTMDTPLENTIAESTMQGEALSRELESSFLDSSGRIDYRALMDKAEALPEQVRFTRFKEMIFTNPNARQIDSKNAVIQTPVGEVKVNVLRAFNHYFKQGKHGNKKENRQVFNATFMPTLLQPKFVTKDEAGTLYYYKPFVSKDKEYHITSIAVKRDGSLEYATSYNATDNRLKQMIKHNELVYFESGLS